MKVVYAAAYPVPSSAANSVHVMKMAQALADNGHDVRLVCPEYNRAEKMDVGDVFAWYSVRPVFTLRRSKDIKPARLGQFVHALKVCMEAKKKNADLVYARCLASGWLAAKTGFAVVFEQHASIEQGLAFSIYKNLLASKNLKALVVISEALKEHVIETTGFKGKIIVAHDGADPLIPAKAPFVKMPGRLQAGYTGHLYEGRGIDVLGETAKLVPEADFHIVGGRPEDVKLWKERLAGITNIVFHGHVAPALVGAYVGAFDVLLAPYQKKVTIMSGMETSRWMSPLKIFEYMAAGKPIICSDIPVLREVLRDGENAVLCAPADAQAWAAVLRGLAADRARAAALGHTALADFEAHYSWKARAAAIMQQI